MKRTLYLLSLLTLAACSNDNEAPAPEVEDNRTEIAFSSNLSTEVTSQPMTRAVTETGFESETRIVMRIKSENGTPAATKYTRTVASAAARGSETYSSVSFASGYQRYWDDAHGRDSKLSVYAVAIENSIDDTKLKEDLLKEGTTNKGNNWTDAPADETVAWTLSKDQNTTTIADENLVYSNNIQNGDNRLKFNETGTTGHGTFEKGTLKFNHALTRITVVLNPGDGFTAFTDVSGVVKSAPHKGTLDLTDGTWSISSPTDYTDITMADITESGEKTLQAQILPGLQLADDASTNIMEFTIDGNVYYVTSKVLYDGFNGRTTTGGVNALTDDYKLKPGINYAVNVTVKKTGVTVTATVVGWDEVSIDETLSNNYIVNLSLYDPTGGKCPKDKIKLYRCSETSGEPSSSSTNPDNLTDWCQAYNGPAELNATGDADVYSATNWYFESNNTYYHFRTTTEGSLDSGNKTFTIQSGFDSEGNELDPHWGAPMKSETGKPMYDATSSDNTKKGFGKYIHSAIGATSDVIKITEFHMLSNVIIKLATTDDGSAVNLTGATVHLLNLYSEGHVDMGNGFITPTGTLNDSYEVKKSGEANTYFSPIVPQALVRDDDTTIGINITTSDGNVYNVSNLGQYNAKAVSSGTANHTAGDAVNRWYPGTQYTYTFTLKKTGIETVTCTITDWDEVEVNGGEITIE